MLDDRLDAPAIVNYPDLSPRLPATALAETIAVEPVFAAVCEQHPLADRDEIELADLAHEPWALTPLIGSAASGDRRGGSGSPVGWGAH
ncbi:type 2 periplasmic-binding domain-containing protein [Micromonospora rubida]|uniref:hypothetical protein n=1 Tax=Micromonospora rubida TaxID=2697657 RepID=UPI001377B2FD|nr:hypothetical protein [Micromonospora rubida]